MLRAIADGETEPATLAALADQREGTLFAVPFDVDRLEPSGPAAPVAEGVITSTLTGAAQFAVSNDGTLASPAKA
jgi:hypothetical protein